jgi:hypothetical protein
MKKTTKTLEEAVIELDASINRLREVRDSLTKWDLMYFKDWNVGVDGLRKQMTEKESWD